MLSADQSGNHLQWFSEKEYVAICWEELNKVKPALSQGQKDQHLDAARDHWRTTLQLFRPGIKPYSPGFADRLDVPRSEGPIEIAVPCPKWSDAAGGIIHSQF